SLPGGITMDYNQGTVLTHETGHWVGLYHTFQDSPNVTYPNVYISKPVASPAGGCPTGRDSC
ncbi:hypothetical protein AURDEDRAFT_23551, partial [Auricularia subglabra TFB-10046 SS5]